MKYGIVFWSFLSLYIGHSQKRIEGIVTDDGMPLKNVNVSVQGIDSMVLTNESGAYSIAASPRDILVFSHLGMQTVEIVVEDVTRILNIKMVPKFEELDEVVVVDRSTKSQRDLIREYNNNPNLIKTGFGILDKETASFSMLMIDGTELPQGAVDFIQALQFKFPGLRVVRSPSDPTRPVVFMRSTGSINNNAPLIFEVDGNVVGDAPTYLDVASIERIAILPSLISAVKYGFEASGGVVVINTKLSKNSIDPETKKPYDYALVRNNNYDEAALGSAEVEKNGPEYQKELLAATSVVEAESVYGKYRDTYKISAYFLLDIVQHFHNTLHEIDLAERIVQENWATFQDNPVVLKALAYFYQEGNNWGAAHEIYKQVLKLRPYYAQSYLDLATSYRELNNHQKALAIFARYDYLVTEGLLERDDEVFGPLMERERNNLLFLHGNDLFSKSDLKKMDIVEDTMGTRLVFEWNDSEAEFDLQFVNPEKKYFVWKHRLSEIPGRIKTEKLVGFSTEEYFIDDSLKGFWQVNAIYYGNKSLAPTHLKVAIYRNYGTLSQQKEIKVFKLQLKDVNHVLFSLNNTSFVTSN